MGNVRAKAEKLFSSHFTGEFSLKQPLPSSFIHYKFTKCGLFKNEFALMHPLFERFWMEMTLQYLEMLEYC